MKELARICKKGGYIITIKSVSYPYHEAPYDCWRIYPEGIKALYEDAGIKVVFSKFESLESYYLNRTATKNFYYGVSAPEDINPFCLTLK